MANTRFQLKRSSVTGVKPTTSDISSGELGINVLDGKLFSTNGSVVFEVGANLSNLFVGNSTVNASVSNATIKLANSTSNLSINVANTAAWSATNYFLHANGSWVQVTGGGGGSSVTTADTAPVSPSDGDLWWNSTDGNLYVYYDDGTSSQWVVSAVGQTGPQGPSGTLAVGSTATGFPGTNASVNNSGNSTSAVFDFIIPRGTTVASGTTTTLFPGASATVTNSGNTSDLVLDFGVPRGTTISVGSTTTVLPGVSASVTNSGNTSDLVLNFSVPRGTVVNVGTTTTGNAGTNANVVNSGNATNLVLDFTVPRGNTGNTGAQGLANGMQTIWVPAISMYPRTTNGPDAGITESTTNKVMLRTYDFDGSTQEFVQFTIRMPKSWDEGSIQFAPYWNAVTANAGNVSFTLAGIALSNNDAIDTAFGTSQSSTLNFTSNNTVHVGPTSANITIAGTPVAGDITMFQLARDVATDTLVADASLMGVAIFMTINAGDDV